MFYINDQKFLLDRIFMFSHARSCSTLLSHILGNNPAINGYYEMRQGYTKAEHLVSQIRNHRKQHLVKPNSKYLFDNIVFEQYGIDPTFILQCTPKIIITLGNPLDSIPSLMQLKAKAKKPAPLATFRGACAHYQMRVRMLVNLAEAFRGQFVYVDANDVVMRTDECFKYLESELELTTPLKTQYDLYPMSTIRGTGDPSLKLKSGILTPGPRARKHNDKLNYHVLAEMETEFLKQRLYMIGLAKPNTTYDPNSQPAIYLGL